MKVEQLFPVELERPDSALRLLGLLSAGISGAIALGVLVLGWGFGVEALTRIRPGYPAMVPETAASIVAAAITAAALFGTLPRWLAAVGLSFIGASILTYFVQPLAGGTGDAMSLATALGLFGFALGAALRLSPRLAGGLAPQVVSTLSVAFSLLPVTGYLFDAASLTAVPGFTEIAPHTAICLVGLNFGLLLLEPDRGWLGILMGPGRGSQMARLMVPVLSALAFVLCQIALQPGRSGEFEPHFRIALLATALVAAIIAMGIALAWQVNRAEERAASLEAARHASDDIRHARELSVSRASSGDLLSRVAAGVAHEFNNALAAMRGNLELIEHDPDNRALYVREALGATDRAAAITAELLASGTCARLVSAPADVEALIRDEVAKFSARRSEKISLWVNLPEGQRAIGALDKAQFHRALRHLLANAQDAIGPNGLVELRVSVENVTNSLAVKFNGGEGIPPGRYTIVDVIDNGIGMGREVLSSATKPFYTTKPIGKGTGLGLSSAYGFCRQSGGGLQIESTQGKGTLVRMALPLVARDPDPATSGAEAASTRFDVLLVGRDPEMCDQMEHRLARDGHSVLPVLTCDAALAALERHPLPTACIVDIGQPARSDRQMLARLIERRYPGCAVTRISPDKQNEESVASGPAAAVNVATGASRRSFRA